MSTPYQTQPQPQPQPQPHASQQPHGQPPPPAHHFAAQPPPPPQAAGAPRLPRAHLGHALASEWTKIRTVRSTVWTLGVMVLLVLGIDLAVASALQSQSQAEMPLFGPALYGLIPGCICVVTLGVLVITSEYGTGMIRSTMTASPARGRVLLAKSIVFFLLAFTVTTVTCVLTALLNNSMLGGKTVVHGSESFIRTVRGGELAADSDDWLSATVGVGLFVALLGLLSLLIGAMLRHSAGAITTMLGVVLLPLVAAPLMMNVESLKDVSETLLNYSPLSGIAAFFHLAFMDQSVSGWEVLGWLAAVTAAALAGAYALLNKRDV